MKPAANHPHEGKTRTRVGPASLLLLLLAALAPALVEASLPRAGASLLEHEEVAASRLDSSRQAAPFRSPAIAPVEPATIGNGFTLFAGDELARASRAHGAPALAPDHAGDLALASREREERFALDQGADAFGLEPLRGPPPLSEDLCQGDDECLAGTRIGGLELEGPFFTEGRPRLSLELQWACSVSSCELADGKPLDPWGLSEQTTEMKEQQCRVTGLGCPSVHDANAIWESQVVQGSVEAVGGAVQVGVGIAGFSAPDPTFITKGAGGVAVVRGLDHVVAGWRSIWARQPVPAVTDGALEGSLGRYGALVGAGLDVWSTGKSLGASRPAAGEKPPFPAPEASERYRWVGHRNAAETEEGLARTVHELPGEVVVRWGDPIGTHGSDVISVNIDRHSGRVTLWDAKYRSNPVSVQPSKTFALEPRVQNALEEAVATLERNTSLSPAVRRKALENLRRGIFESRTVGAGNAKNSVLR